MKNLYSLIFRNYGHKPAIKFIGKRHDVHPSKHIDIHQNQNSSVNPIKTVEHVKQTIEQIRNSISVNPLSTHNMRARISQEEIEYINNGGPLNYKDWNKIKIKSKK